MYVIESIQKQKQINSNESNEIYSDFISEKLSEGEYKLDVEQNNLENRLYDELLEIFDKYLN